jgi:hypothetical protein
MGGTARVNGPCVVSWAEGLVHSTVRHAAVPCRHDTVANYIEFHIRL